jgi:alpha-mannosidase
MRRKKTPKLSIEGNYYPITSSIFIQDESLRATLITNHAQGASSANEGEMEVMVDKRTPVDDSRGMEEGVKDIVPTTQNFWLTLEFLSGTKPNPKKYNVPSLHVHHLTNILNYPANVFLNQASLGKVDVHRKLSLLKKPLPCDLNLFNLRTLNDANQVIFPSRSALLIVHKLSYDCDIGVHDNLFYSQMCLNNAANFDSINLFDGISIQQVQSTSLTALKSHGSIASFKSETIEAMDLKTFNVTFV